MELHESIQIIKKLARGIDPTTGNAFPTDSPYNDARVIRALYLSLESMPRMKKTNEEKRELNRLKGLPVNSGLPWDEKDRLEVTRDFKANLPVEEIASKFGRSVIAIVAELERKGLMSQADAERYGYMKRSGQTPRIHAKQK